MSKIKVMALMIAASAVTATTAAAAGPPDRADGSSLAFLTSSELGLVRDDKIVAQVSGRFAHDGIEREYNTLHYTDDGRFVFALSHRFSDDASIVVINVKTLQRRELRCGCGAAMPAGGAMVAWIDANGRLARADLATDSDVRTTALAAPDGIVFFEPLALMGVGGVLLVEADASDGTQVVIVGTDGTVRRLPSDIWPSVTAATSGTAARNPQIAFAGHRGIEPCGDGMDVVVVDATTGQAVLADTDTLQAGADGPLVDDLWWGPDGALYATIRSLDCDNRERGLAMQPSLWRLDGIRWTNVDPKPLNAVRWLSAETRAIVEAQSADGPFTAPGRLYVETAGRRTFIADDVLMVDAFQPVN